MAELMLTTKFLEIWPLLKKHCGYSRDNIPQAEDISRFTKMRSRARKARS